MGYRGDYVLTRQTPEDVAAALDLTRLADVDYVPTNIAWIGQLKNGWTVFVPFHEGYCSQLTASLRAMSEDADVVTCSINETVMASEASGYRDGAQDWHLGFVSDVGPGKEHFTRNGHLPDILDADETFEGPIRAVEAITGYCYDGIFEPKEFEAIHLVDAPTHPHMAHGLLSRMIENRPFVTLVVGFIVLVVFMVYATLVLQSVLEPLIRGLLGD